MIGTSFGYCEHYLVLRDLMENGQVQEEWCPSPENFFPVLIVDLSAKKTDISTLWEPTVGKVMPENGSLERIRWTGGKMALPESIETRKNGLILRFNESIDPSSLNSKKAFAAQWNYLHSEAYGSPEYSVRNPGLSGHDPVKIRSLHALKDGKSVFVEIPQAAPG